MSYKPFLDPTIPRPAPRLPIIASNFNYDKPAPLVSEASLIFDYHNSKNSDTALNSSNHIDTSRGSRPGELQCSISPLLQEFMSKVEQTVNQLQSQIDSVSASQESQSRRLEDIYELLSNRLNLQTCEQSVQTEEIRKTPSPTTGRPVVEREQRAGNVAEIPKSRHNSGSSSKSSSESRSSQVQAQQHIPEADPNKVTATRLKKSSPKNAIAPRVNDDKEDLSMVLKDLKLPAMEENSMFSETSLRTIDLEEFDNSLNDSSDGGDESPEGSFQEVVKPTTTFYRNVIGNVNKLLDNSDREPTVYGSETTFYGMSSTNLSFATRQYLQKYGLTKSGKKQVVHTQPEPYWEPEPPTKPKERMLDMTALKNQPKLM